MFRQLYEDRTAHGREADAPDRLVPVLVTVKTKKSQKKDSLSGSIIGQILAGTAACCDQMPLAICHAVGKKDTAAMAAATCHKIVLWHPNGWYMSRHARQLKGSFGIFLKDLGQQFLRDSTHQQLGVADGIQGASSCRHFKS